MTIYGELTSWDKFKQKLEDVEGASTKNLTDYIDKNLFNGGQIKDLHEKIIAEQIRRGGYRYKTCGYLFNNKGKVQQGTFFGHIAHLIVDEDCIIEIDNIEIKESHTKDFLYSKYDQNSFIRIEGFKGIRRKDTAIRNSTQAKFPSQDNCEAAVTELSREDKPGTDDNVLDRIQENDPNKGSKWHPDWRKTTLENMKKWSQ